MQRPPYRINLKAIVQLYLLTFALIGHGLVMQSPKQVKLKVSDHDTASHHSANMEANTWVQQMDESEAKTEVQKMDESEADLQTNPSIFDHTVNMEAKTGVQQMDESEAKTEVQEMDEPEPEDEESVADDGDESEMPFPRIPISAEDVPDAEAEDEDESAAEDDESDAEDEDESDAEDQAKSADEDDLRSKNVTEESNDDDSLHFHPSPLSTTPMKQITNGAQFTCAGPRSRAAKAEPKIWIGYATNQTKNGWVAKPTTEKEQQELGKDIALQDCLDACNRARWCSYALFDKGKKASLKCQGFKESACESIKNTTGWTAKNGKQRKEEKFMMFRKPTSPCIAELEDCQNQ